MYSDKRQRTCIRMNNTLIHFLIRVDGFPQVQKLIAASACALTITFNHGNQACTLTNDMSKCSNMPPPPPPSKHTHVHGLL